MLRASFLTIAQSVNRCSLSETFCASFKATGAGAGAGAFAVFVVEGVSVVREDADLVEFCAGTFGGSELARCRYAWREEVCSPANRVDTRCGLAHMGNRCILSSPADALDDGRRRTFQPPVPKRELICRVANAISSAGLWAVPLLSAGTGCGPL